jgi:hypothetical protein
MKDPFDKRDFEIIMKSSRLYSIILSILFNLRLKSKHSNKKTISIEKFKKEIYDIIKENECSDLF